MGRFFIPGVLAEEAEGRYEELAAVASTFMGRRVLVPPEQRRVESVRWIRDGGQEWTGIVGSQLSGTEQRPQTKRGQRVMVTTELNDAATVLAIFSAGDTHVVITDAIPLGPARSSWTNPFMTGEPKAIRYFDATSALDEG